MKLNIDFSELREYAAKHSKEKIGDNDFPVLIAFFLRNQFSDWDVYEAFNLNTLQLYDGYLELEMVVF